MKDVSVSINKNYYDEDYVLTFSKLTKDEAQGIINASVFPQEKTPDCMKSLKDFTYYKQQGWCKAVRIFAASNEVNCTNKIEQIKFLRSISDLGLKDAKDLVDYMLHDAMAPAGLKFSAEND